MAGRSSRFRQPIQIGDVKGASAVKRWDGYPRTRQTRGNATCALICSRLARNEGEFPTLEVVVTGNPAELGNVMRPGLGIALIDLDRSGDRPTSCSGDVACPAAGNPGEGDRADQGQERSCLRSE